MKSFLSRTRPGRLTHSCPAFAPPILPVRQVRRPPLAEPRRRWQSTAPSAGRIVSTFPSRRRNDIDREFRVFASLCRNRFRQVLADMGTFEEKQSFYRAFGLSSGQQLQSAVRRFEKELDRSIVYEARRRPGGKGSKGKAAGGGSEDPSFLLQSLQLAFVRGDIHGLTAELKYSFQSFLFRSQFPKLWSSENYTQTHKVIADCRYPWEWFPATRALQRTVHVHLGPTNSGKTYNALKALEGAKSGIYAGPLRLLAQEIYLRLNAKGKPCALVTGDHQVLPEDATRYYFSCTVEMALTNTVVDVGVIDEIQMVADPERGWAWVQAFFGMQARELHVCGEERAAGLIEAMCAAVGDRCVVHRYERLSPLATMDESLDGDLTRLQKGDAVVAFSRIALHALKRKIETTTGRRCAIVYGSLPPQTRAQQAALFNEPDNDYDFLVATDAIGMGLNLEIKRVVFSSTIKRTGSSYFTRLPASNIMQIGGRAGRFRTAAQEMRSFKKPEADAVDAEPGTTPAQDSSVDGVHHHRHRHGHQDHGHQGKRSVGLVTTLEDIDLRSVQTAFATSLEPLRQAMIRPSTAAIEQMASYFPPNTPLSFILLRLRELARTSPLFAISDMGGMIEMADLIQEYPLHITDRCVFLACPMYGRDINTRRVIKAMARCVSTNSTGHLLDDLPEMPLGALEEQWLGEGEAETGEAGVGADADEQTPQGPRRERPMAVLARLESLHRCLTIYLWLSYRFSGVFRSRRLALHAVELTEERIGAVLQSLGDHLAKGYRSATAAQVRASAEAERQKRIVESFLAASSAAAGDAEGENAEVGVEGGGIGEKTTRPVVGSDGGGGVEAAVNAELDGEEAAASDWGEEDENVLDGEAQHQPGQHAGKDKAIGVFSDAATDGKKAEPEAS